MSYLQLQSIRQSYGTDAGKPGELYMHKATKAANDILGYIFGDIIASRRRKVV